MSKKLMTVVSLIIIFAFVLAACAPADKITGPVNITLWTKEGEADGGLQYVQALADAFTKENPNVTFEVINKEVEILREDFQTCQPSQCRS